MSVAIVIAIKHNVAPQFLDFVGITDCTVINRGMLWQFNIEDPDHPNYKSTVAVEVKND